MTAQTTTSSTANQPPRQHQARAPRPASGCGAASVTPITASRPRTLKSVPTSVPTVIGADLLVPSVNGPVVHANLDHGATTPALTSVKEAVDRALQTYASVHRGAGYTSRLTSGWFELARDEVASFVGAREDDHVIFTRSTTDSWAVLAKALPERTTVFVFATEHHSTLLPWERSRTVRLPVPQTVEDAVALLEEALEEHPAQQRLVVLAGASNVTGEIWPIETFAEVAHRHGARIAVDAAQLAPHRPLDISAWQVDYLAFSGHKLYAPFGAGVLVGRADWLDAGTPYLAGGGATREVSERGTRWNLGPGRHEGGSPNVIGAVALAAACASLTEHQQVVLAHEERLLARLRTGLDSIEGVTQLSIFDDEHDRVGVVAFTVDGYPSALVSQILAAEHGISVRDGKFCAHLLVDDLLSDPWSERGTTAVRASIGLATTDEAVERLITALADLVENGPLATWRLVEDRWVIDGEDPRESAEVTSPW